jgi:DNA-binding CsgD family transcriptional regulator
MALQDSILVKKTSQWVSDRELNFEFGKKEQELKDLHTKMRQRKTIALLLTVLGILFFLLIAISLRARWKVLRQRNELLESEKEISRLAIEKRKSEEERLKEEMKSRERILKVEREKLQQEVDFKKRELVGKVLNLSSQKKQFTKLREVLEEGANGKAEDLQQTMKQALSLLRTGSSTTDDWESFQKHFEEVHPKFFEKLRSSVSHLSASEERMAAYLVLNLNPKEIAQISSISPDSVRKRKQRLREKFDLSGKDDLREYLLQFLEY